MYDAHNNVESRNIKIDDIGINGLKLPFCFKSQNDQKGAHLSRIIEVLNDFFYNKVISIEDFSKILYYLSKKVESKNVKLETNFDIIIPNLSPKTSKFSTILSNITIISEINPTILNNDIKISLNGAMCCPSSKKISKYGAHSQRCLLTTTILNATNNIYVEDVISLLQDCFSAPVSSVVKREDEKFLTERAYENPKFSEDLIRDTLLVLKKNYPNNRFIAEMNNYESIHSHNVFCKGRI